MEKLGEAEQRLRDWHSELAAANESLSDLQHCVHLEHATATSLQSLLHAREKENKQLQRRVDHLYHTNTSLLSSLQSTATSLRASKQAVDEASAFVRSHVNESKKHCYTLLSTLSSCTADTGRRLHQLSARTAELEQALASSQLHASELHASLEQESSSRARTEHAVRFFGLSSLF